MLFILYYCQCHTIIVVLVITVIIFLNQNYYYILFNNDTLDIANISTRKVAICCLSCYSNMQLSGVPVSLSRCPLYLQKNKKWSPAKIPLLSFWLYYCFILYTRMLYTATDLYTDKQRDIHMMNILAKILTVL